MARKTTAEEAKKWLTQQHFSVWRIVYQDYHVYHTYIMDKNSTRDLKDQVKQDYPDAQRHDFVCNSIRSKVI